ncbi:fasciclin domain-containing protein [Gordonia sp. HNM0687]|uniref:Fasciclin domain-containing protein n=1 Tax=Gordonia mangrovi TaxID=2665643 RepID=A0A6L7GWJ0_9ACTN|nr:fasciclin domain-containing protein [Gordonia mangrovi]MDY6807726.1 fasciclin domain-containing protein [Actinomycetota bacterium]MXP24280.1 fasciclin domain-containing protein [Gordonia mangrovi]UVF79901.1 fasciclin domain-containing protein [Gordonia mangrovi]
MALKRIHRVLTAAAGVTLAVGLVAGCSSDDDSSSETTAATSAPMTSMESESDSATAASGLVGPGCAAYAEANPTGPASVDGMAAEPVATAASNNPMLTTLTQAVSGELNPEVNLVDTLNNGEYTVFAPTDDAFAKLPPETIEALQTDATMLTDILTYHVVDGQAGPDAIAGEHETLQGQSVEVTGEGEEWMVNDAAVVCGGVQTANATVYLIDTVLTPPAE